MAIGRIWRSATLSTKSEQYLEYSDALVIRACRIAGGNEGCFVKSPK